MKKKLAATLSVVLILGLATLGILAYLTSEDSDVNVMTLGNVQIEQIEQQKNADGELEPFEQAKGLYPGTEISKIVTVKNTGESDCYFRTLIAFEDIDSDTFGMGFPISESGYRWSWGAPEATIEIDGVTYQVYEALYTKTLNVGKTSPASLTKVEFATTCTNEDMEALGGTYEILVLSQAVQVEGFADAETALDTAFGDVTDATAAEWFGGMVIPVVVETAAEFETALDNGDAMVLANDIALTNATTVDKAINLDLNNKTLATVGLDLKAGGSIENGTIASGGNTNMTPHLKVTGGELVMDNVTVKIDDYLSNVGVWVETTGFEAVNATVIMNDSTIFVENNVRAYNHYTYGITATNANVTMNGGAIIVKSVDTITAAGTNLKTAISGMSNNTVTLKNVNVDADTLGSTMGHLILNTTDSNVTGADFVSYGGTYELNIIK